MVRGLEEAGRVCFKLLICMELDGQDGRQLLLVRALP